MGEMSLQKAINMVADLDRLDPDVLKSVAAQLGPNLIRQAQINLSAASERGTDAEFWQTLRDGWRPTA
ncbi:hypothetical protein BA059_03295 [Mycolicibacterium sp. (ex Dasyatis americana)]|uniref:Uncharacterized protein n=1 Tax=Mycolicibacterium fortuitum TaxID=1766 RepID=A0A0N7H8L6_MYCFO|nr:hypothetical protein [Mycolicibacterium fortuitum]ALI26567.1 hypothetical protein XA26_27270 [Mycolicibacterium fortuitum]OFB43699.1 hypothetical protein BA059_03295 [Mycolicibacterium sp. (ex Dasyatis americana)]